MGAFQTIRHTVQFCVVGGGLSGLCAAIAAARRGVHTALIQDRPMLGGNASSEIRMWVCGAGAYGDHVRETGLIEEILLENQYRNPYRNYYIWDSILLEKAMQQPNLDLYLNCSCMDGVMDGDKLRSVTCWQLTTQQYHAFEADLFADCSGDSVLAPITGAAYRMGREGRGEFDEDIAPPVADQRTMGMSLLIQAREYADERVYIAPTWAKKFTRDDLPHRMPDLHNPGENFWYLELGGMGHTIDDTESVRDELLRVAYGIWDYVKNDPEHCEKNKRFDIEFIGILPGKRESRRYIGDHILTQHDVRSGGRFDDVVAYGGWSMDDHHPGGLYTSEPPTIYHPAPCPYGIPYRCLYSKNVGNLFCAGRNISVTHTAMSSTRVMATCALLGQAVGTAAALAVEYHTSPRGVYEYHVPELQQALMDDDCYLPHHVRAVSRLTEAATLSSDMQHAPLLRDGVERIVDGVDHAAVGGKGCYVRYDLPEPSAIQAIRLVFDSDLNRETLPDVDRSRPMRHNILLQHGRTYVPKTIVRDFTVVVGTTDGVTAYYMRDNHQRLCALPMQCDDVRYVSVILHDTWGADLCRLYAFDVM